MVMVKIPARDENDLEDKIILSVRTKGFESQIEVPVPISPTDMIPFVNSWLEMMHQAMKMPHVSGDGKGNLQSKDGPGITGTRR